jgi:8-oxo-dGTP diphosphatase
VLVRLVRHGCAGDKQQWVGDDAARPLDALGWVQAHALADVLDLEPAGRLLSSPTRRCIATLSPLARRWDVPVVSTDALAVGADVDAVLDLLTTRACDGDVLCTHGEVMEALLARLPVEGDDDLLAKGSLWELTVDDGRVVDVRHVVPERFVRT